ncbi:hypothetical protein EVG20_g4174 [Dentipellis fragilis]|uniref:Uncharacterized protein n=1 Tax=Dentipellis fragilis TaxID=205917 RepID=A0A4Y9Z0K9_9AGAM|nr:hypothetical protein EVG20_g4174 [Dentipellis fragilis]
MPHKRAKRSLREQRLNEKGRDLAAPSTSLANEGIPKSASRILNAAKIRDDFKKRKVQGDDQAGPAKKRRRPSTDIEGVTKAKTKGKQIAIKPGETLAHFNRRVEEDMRPLVRSAVQTASAVERNARKMQGKDVSSARQPSGKEKKQKGRSESPDSSPPPDKHRDRPKEFSNVSTSAPRRLNDIAMAPPDLKKLPRGAKNLKEGATKKSAGVVSMAQKAMMEEERERVIKRYREMKEKKLLESRSTRISEQDDIIYGRAMSEALCDSRGLKEPDIAKRARITKYTLASSSATSCSTAAPPRPSLTPLQQEPPPDSTAAALACIQVFSHRRTPENPPEPLHSPAFMVSLFPATHAPLSQYIGTGSMNAASWRAPRSYTSRACAPA